MFFILFYKVSIVNLAFWKLKENYCCAATNLDVLIHEDKCYLVLLEQNYNTCCTIIHV